MLKELKFCAGSVAKKDYVPGLKHFVIENGFVRGFNGTLALCSPIAFDICCRPVADKLIKAVANCEDTIQLALTPAGRLSIKSGVFKVIVECINEETPHVQPEGEIVNFNGEALFEGIKAVERFIGTDASRLWAQGILVKDKSLFATNNVILVQYWLGVEFPHTINIPRAAVKEMLRIGEAPLFAQVAENSITFHYEGDRWLRTQLYDLNWPDISPILSKPSNQFPIDERIFKGLEAIKPFVDKAGLVKFENAVMSTTEVLGEGAEYFIPDLQWDGRYAFEMLALLEGIVDTIDWSTYPAPCAFTGAKNRLRGVIIGRRP